MQIEVIENKDKIRTNYYSVVVDTMEGDADDYHEITLDFENNEEGLKELRECVIACEVIRKHYPRGGAGGGGFNECPYWMKWFYDNDWFHDDMGCPDSFSSYGVYYYDETGKKNVCKLTFDEEMKDEISKAKILKGRY